MSVHVPERQLTGHEPALIAALTEAVVRVYGEWAREQVIILLEGVREGRWGIGGRAVDDAGPAVTFGIRDSVFTRPDAEDVLARLAASLTDAVAAVLGEQTRAGTTVELVATPAGRTARAGVITE